MTRVETGRTRGTILAPVEAGGSAGTCQDPAALAERIRDTLAARGEQPDLAAVSAWVARYTGTRGTQAVQSLAQQVLARLVGFGPLQPLVDAPEVTDVLVNGDGSVWVEDAGGLHRVPGLDLEAVEVRRLAVRLMTAGGRRVDDAQPFADVVVADVRVHAVLPPVAVGAPLLSLRRVRSAAATLDALYPERGDPWPELLRRVVQLRLNFLISGGTGAGKTTLLSAMLAAVPEAERIVIVEDAHELAPAHPHAVALQSRAPNTESVGGVDLTMLVRQALRMRPDRLVVGECRGEEVRDVLMALNTGHDGAGGTLHANAVDTVGERLIALGALGGWDARSTALQAASAVDVVIHVARRGGARRPVALSSLVPDAAGLRCESIVTEVPGAEGTVRLEPGPAADWFARTAGRG